MFLDDELKQIWNDAVHSREKDYAKVFNSLMQACFNRLEGNRNSVKRVDASYALFAKSKRLQENGFRAFYLSNARANNFSEDKIEALCKYLGWNYDDYKLKTNPNK